MGRNLFTTGRGREATARSHGGTESASPVQGANASDSTNLDFDTETTLEACKTTGGPG